MYKILVILEGSRYEDPEDSGMEIHDDFSWSISILVLRIRAILGHVLYIYFMHYW